MLFFPSLGPATEFFLYDNYLDVLNMLFKDFIAPEIPFTITPMQIIGPNGMINHEKRKNIKPTRVWSTLSANVEA